METTYTVKVNGKAIESGLISLPVAMMDYQAAVRDGMKKNTGALVELFSSDDPKNPMNACHARRIVWE